VTVKCEVNTRNKLEKEINITKDHLNLRDCADRQQTSSIIACIFSEAEFPLLIEMPSVAAKGIYIE